MKSIMQTEKKCYICSSMKMLENHHIFLSSNRDNSEKYGLKVYLCYEHHRAPKTGVHHNKMLMDYLHKEGQKAFEKVHGTNDDFRKIFFINYL